MMHVVECYGIRVVIVYWVGAAFSVFQVTFKWNEMINVVESAYRTSKNSRFLSYSDPESDLQTRFACKSSKFWKPKIQCSLSGDRFIIMREY